LRSSANAGALLAGLLGGSLFWRIVARGFVRGGQLIPTLLNFSESDEFLMGAGETYGERLMVAIANIRTPVTSLEPGFLERLTPTLNQPILQPFAAMLERNVENLAFASQATMLGEYLSLTVAYFATAVVSFLLVFALCSVVFLFLAALAERAGIHRYVTTPDQVWATSTLLGISVDAPGPRTIRLPRGHAGDALRDPLSGETFPVDRQKCATVDFAEGATRVFFLLDKE